MTTTPQAAMTMQQLSQAVFDRAVHLAKHRARCLEVAKSPWCHNKQMMLEMAAQAEADIAYEAQLADWYAQRMPEEEQPTTTVAATLACALVELAQAQMQTRPAQGSVSLHLQLRHGQAQQLSDELMAGHGKGAARLQALHDLLANLAQVELTPGSAGQPPALAAAHAPVWPSEEPVPQTHCFSLCAPCASLSSPPPAPQALSARLGELS